MCRAKQATDSMDRVESGLPRVRRWKLPQRLSIVPPVRGQQMKGQQAVDLVAPFFALITVLALVAFSPLNKFSRPIRFFLFGGIGSAVTMMILLVIGLLGKVSTGVWRFDVVLSVIASALIGLSQFGSSGKLTDKNQDEPERIHKQDSGWF